MRDKILKRINKILGGVYKCENKGIPKNGDSNMFRLYSLEMCFVNNPEFDSLPLYLDDLVKEGLIEPVSVDELVARRMRARNVYRKIGDF